MTNCKAIGKQTLRTSTHANSVELPNVPTFQTLIYIILSVNGNLATVINSLLIPSSDVVCMAKIKVPCFFYRPCLPAIATPFYKWISQSNLIFLSLCLL